MPEQSVAANYTPDLTKLAQSIPVHTADGVLLVGWAVRNDTVVVHASGLTGTLTATVDDRPIEAVDTHEAVKDVDSWQPLTALELPQGSLRVAGELFPPHMLPAVASADDPQTLGARISFWCLVFRRMRGC